MAGLLRPAIGVCKCLISVERILSNNPLLAKRSGR